jgi:hypothetical protein
MLGLAQVLDFKLVLVQIGGPLFEFLNHLLVLQLKQLDLLGLLLQQLNHILPLGLRDQVIFLCLVSLLGKQELVSTELLLHGFKLLPLQREFLL